MTPWHAVVLTLHPAAFPGPLGVSLAGKALAEGVWTLETVDIRAYARDKHATVDDSPFGGGPGMVMRPDVLAAAIDATQGPAGTEEALILLTPRGQPLTQARVRALAQTPRVRVVCGRYEGVDERVIDARGLEEVSVGDFVLSGGEPAAIALIDACVRLLPGVVGAPASLADESFEDDLLEYPHYTRPQVWEEREVPEVLLSGHHERVRAWRRAAAEGATAERRPDLWARHTATKRHAN
ncbi:MAG: tRNA (guanosine(37)-N1)-methyltransferase TrmD [Alphaproteobacteria bacterium]|nr:tRNA (guanosine(37)-N1)-methyltransferase TrmD [Alphaproteobacteria bacterium]